MLKWFKKLTSEQVSPASFEKSAAYLSAIMGTPYFTPQNPGPDMSENIKRHGTETRVFKGTRHDN